MKVGSADKHYQCWLLSVQNHWMSPSAPTLDHVTEFRAGLSFLSADGHWARADEAFGFVWTLQLWQTAVIIESVQHKRPVYPSPGPRPSKQFMKFPSSNNNVECRRSALVISVNKCHVQAFFCVFIGLRGPWRVFHRDFVHPQMCGGIWCDFRVLQQWNKITELHSSFLCCHRQSKHLRRDDFLSSFFLWDFLMRHCTGTFRSFNMQ